MKYNAFSNMVKQIYRYILSDINKLIDMVLYRFMLYIAALYAGYLLLQPFFESVRLNIFSLTLLEGNYLFDSALALFLLTFPVVTLNWLLRNRDTLRQSRQMRDQQNEGLLTNALQLLFKENDRQANSVGLKELVRLKQNRSIDPARIDLITATELDLGEALLDDAYLQEANLRRASLQKANLQGTNLQKADLPGANLEEANLSEANLQEANLLGANLREANLRGAILREADLQGTKGLTPGMLRKAKNWREAILDPNLRQQAEEADRADQAIYEP